MKKILFLQPNEINGSPAYERVKAFSSFFKEEGFNVEHRPYPISYFSLVKLFFYIYWVKVDYIFISQPPFKYPIIFLFPFVKKIIDYRDGWSIAIEDGYGGLVKPNKLKAKIASTIENFSINRSIFCVVCTPGLYNYFFEKTGGEKLILIPNGISKENFYHIKNLDKKNIKENGLIKFYCAGKFSEYGTERVRGILGKINERYKGVEIEIHLIGSNYDSNIWIEKYIPENFSLKIYERMGKDKLYEELNKADIFLSVVRDERYELGTKIYEYLAFQKPIFNYFESRNNFVNYFDGAFDKNFKKNNEFTLNIVREALIQEKKTEMLKAMANEI